MVSWYLHVTFLPSNCQVVHEQSDLQRGSISGNSLHLKKTNASEVYCVVHALKTVLRTKQERSNVVESTPLLSPSPFRRTS